MTSLAAVLGLEATALDLWERAVAAGVLTARGGQKVLRVARTIADLEDSERLEAIHLAEALTYRGLDRDQSRPTP
jgi:magnesium chelatase family protein